MRPAVMPPPTFEPAEPELYEAPIGPAAGCLVGLAMAAVWWIWTLIVR